MVQEFVHHRLRRTSDHTMAAEDGYDLAAMIKLLDFDTAVLELALDLIGRNPNVRGRDAVHAATGLLYGIETIVSPDPAFDDIGGLRREDPRAMAGSEAC
jgi:predicted nucleic acid-binding protein